MIRIAIAGAAGRMGQALIQAVLHEDDVELTHAFELKENKFVGSDVGVITGIGEVGVPLGDSVSQGEFDLLIDFTAPVATVANVTYCESHGQSVVIGTTGFDEESQKKVSAAATNIPIVQAPNMSIGVNLALELLDLAARTFGDSVDIEIIEAHHSEKVDAPSGTALRMGQVVADALELDLSERGVYTRHGQVGRRESNTIGFATVRAGDIVGEHSVWFVGGGERIEINHKATSRDIYATGALRAAKWLIDQPKGLYDMQNVLGFKG